MQDTCSCTLVALRKTCCTLGCMKSGLPGISPHMLHAARADEHRVLKVGNGEKIKKEKRGPNLPTPRPARCMPVAQYADMVEDYSERRKLQDWQ